MQISFRCSACQCKMAIDASAAGQQVQCPQCGTDVVVPQARLGPGVTIGGFRIERLLGTGGMGEVYLARQLSMDRPVALKILAAHARSPEDKERFVQEVKTLARLEHPNIVTAHEAGEDGGYLYLAMSYVNGEALDRRLATQGRIPEREALRIVRKIARALEYAWTEHRLLHRDIKPGNILMDAHGEPKLADLGLAQSVQAAEGRTDRPRVAGTPNYMSPEQAEGRDDLDCRSDIYALGATLYHMLTGQLPYAADTPEETLRRKFEEPLPDPRSFQPQISPATVALLSGMLAHDRAERYSTWKELITDLDRVLAGKPPLHGSLPGEPTNRVRVTAAELQAIREGGSTPRSRPVDVLIRLGVTLAAIVVVAVVARLVLRQAGSGADQRPGAPAVTSAPPDPAHARLSRLESDYLALLQFQKDHGSELREVIRRWTEFERESQGTEFARLARQQLESARRRLQAEVQAAFQALQREVEPLVASNQFAEARRRLDEYDGPWKAETAEMRAAESARLRAMEEQAALERERTMREALERGRAEAVRLLVRLKPSEAIAAWDQAVRQAGADASSEPLATFRNLLLAAQRSRELVLEAVRADVGRTVELQLTGGTEAWEILGVNGNAIQARRKVGGGYAERTIQYAELSPAERFRRLERVPAPANRVLQALLLIEGGNLPAARRHLEAAASDPFVALMLRALEEEAQAAAETAAQRALAALWRRLGVPEGASAAEAAAKIRRTGYPANDLPAIRAAVAEFRRTHGSTRCAAEAEEALASAERVHTQPREVDPAVLERARDGLRRANPALTTPPDALLRSTPSGLELNVDAAAAEQLVTLAPLASLPVVRIVLTAPPWRDLALLRGLPAEELEIRGGRLESYDVLRQLPLRRLALVRCRLDNLAMLAGLGLESLDVSENRLSTIATLTGMPLRRLNISQNAQITTVRHLTGMPLEELRMDGCSRVDDLRPLRGLPLKTLSMEGTAVADLSPLADLPLEVLNVSGCTQVRDWSPIRALKLVELRLNGVGLTDVSFLAGLPLRRLQISDNRELTSLEPLRGMRLESLHAARTQVADLSPLVGMPLEHLVLSHCPLTDLTPLADLPLKYLDLAGCARVRHLSALMRLTKLTTLVIAADTPRWRALVADIKSLKYVGTSPDTLMSVAEFDAAPPPEGAPSPPGPPPVRRP
ncbi:MAG: protein kinase [Kiritimatiellae bacterium]|nr:protein kinase [Kiritimatiellia bacterium]